MIRKSKDIDQLAPALLAAQREVKHPPKNAANSHFRNEYADLNSVLDTVVPAFNKHGLTITQFVSGNTLHTLLLHESGQWLETTGSEPIVQDRPGIQAFGSALTYMRRYTVQALAGVSSEKDDDAEGAVAPRTNTPKKRNSPPVDAEW